ncbi:hypothetical protein ONZ43_g1255 [Nemania bipapillata]|uniref:Uncharacterized protein n=1 Tax=Nemania bipapillata TaxID=110536 RepID=A0ACC2J523_9PEZI|nr:hypothetical protein ONZ43_g1255 [Nemania bipapillata]
MSSIPPGVDLCKIPAGKAPDGWKSNLVNPETLAPATISVVTILTVWAFTFAVARFYVNWRKYKLADYFMACGLILSITYSGLIISLNRYNRHMWDVPVCWLTPSYLKTIFAHTTIVGSVLFFPKCAILFMYRDLFEIRTFMRIAICGVVASVIALVFRVKLLHTDDSTWESARLAIAVVVENTVAIVVGCMPAFAKFFKLYLADLPPIRSLRTKIWGSSAYSSSKSAEPLPNGTFGSPIKPKKALNHYYELTESGFAQTQVTVRQDENVAADSGEAGIIRTLSVSQQSGPDSKPESVEKLL